MVVVAAIDRSDRASAVVEEAVRLAGGFDEPVHLVHAVTRAEFVELEQAEYDETGRALPMDEVKAFAEEHAFAAAEGLDVPFDTVGLVGNPADEVVRYADDVAARFIVVAPRRRSPAGKALFGSVAQRIILEASCPVVATPTADR